jgi:hypothetical protein
MYIPSTVENGFRPESGPDRGICEGLVASITAWNADEYHYQLHDVLQYMGEGGVD